MKTMVLRFLNPGRLYSIIGMCVLTLAGLAQDGQNDFTFNTIDKVATQGTDNSVKIAVVLTDNKIVIGGGFTTYNGATANKLARLNVDGKIDKSFNAGLGADGTINTLAVQTNFKMIIAGDFTSYNGWPVNKIARVNANGTLDKSFQAGEGADNSITKVLIQADEKIIVAGDFTTYNGKPAKGMIRLNKNGTVDKSFDAKLTDSLIKIHQVALLPDGKILIAGQAKNFFGDMRNFIETIRLNNNGSRDYGFTESKFSTGDVSPKVNCLGLENDGNILLAATLEDGANSAPYRGMLVRTKQSGQIIKKKATFWINSMVVQNDGKVLALGFDNPDWNIIKRVVVRMNQDLTIDSTFALNDNKVFGDPSECSIQTLAIQNNGKLIIGGNFFEVNGLNSGNIARLNSNGSFDDTFNQRKGSNGGVFASAKQADGKLIIGGEFTKFNGQAASNIARLKKNGEIDQTFDGGSGTNGKVYTVAVLPSGKILVGGSFTSYNGIACSNLIKLSLDGSIDKTFKNLSFDGIVRNLTIDKNNNVIVGGDFINVNNVHRNAVARISQNGDVDATFQPIIDKIGTVYDSKISNDGSIYIALNYKNTPEYSLQSTISRLYINGSIDYNFQFEKGYFTEINSIVLVDENKKILAAGLGHYTKTSFFPPVGLVTRWNDDGSIDSTFDFKPLEQYLNKTVRTVSVIMDDRIIIGGDFDVDKTSINHIAMLDKNGDINFDFVGNANGNVYCSTIIENNRLLLGGIFSEYSSFVRNGLAKITFDMVAEQPTSNGLVSVQLQQLSVYPNPAIASVTIDHLQTGSTVKIYNMAGVELFSGIVSSEMQTVDLSEYSNGVYFIMTEKNGIKENSKFIVSK